MAPLRNNAAERIDMGAFGKNYPSAPWTKTMNGGKQHGVAKENSSTPRQYNKVNMQP